MYKSIEIQSVHLPTKQTVRSRCIEMKIVKNSNSFDEMAVFHRLDEIAVVNDGLGHFNERDVFVASGSVRVVINSLPDMVNLIEFFALEWAAGRLKETDVIMGESLFSRDAIMDMHSQDLTALVKGKERELFNQIRLNLIRHSKANTKTNNKRPQVGDLIDTLSCVTSVRVENCDPLITDMCVSGLFNNESIWLCHVMQESLASAIANLIAVSIAEEDFELISDALRSMLRF